MKILKHSKALRLILLSVFCAPFGLYAQSPPATDVFLVSMHHEGGRLVFGNPKKISRYAGYNNQPAFTPDGRSVLFSSDSTGMMDIFRYWTDFDSLSQVTFTPDVGEYSPTPVSADRFVSVVVEPDQRQRLWQYDLGSGTGQLFISDRDSVGYFEILDGGDVAMFVLGSPPTLRVWNRDSGTEKLLEGVPGRCLQTIPNLEGFSYVDKSRPDRWIIAAADPLTNSRVPIAQMPEGSEDYAWSPNGDLYAASGSTLYVYSSEADGVWKTALDFRHFGLANITRMAISPDGSQIAMVSPFVPVPPPVE